MTKELIIDSALEAARCSYLRDKNKDLSYSARQDGWIEPLYGQQALHYENKFKAMYEIYINHCQSNHISEKQANRIFKKAEQSAYDSYVAKNATQYKNQFLNTFKKQLDKIMDAEPDRSQDRRP